MNKTERRSHASFFVNNSQMNIPTKKAIKRKISKMSQKKETIFPKYNWVDIKMADTVKMISKIRSIVVLILSFLMCPPPFCLEIMSQITWKISRNRVIVIFNRNDLWIQFKGIFISFHII